MRRLIILLGTLAALSAGPALADTLAEVKAGNAAFAEGRYEAAVEAFSKAILAGDLDPDFLAVTFNNRGVAYGELGDYDRAVQDYSQALSLKPGDKTSTKNLRIAYTRRAAAHVKLGERDQALADYAKAIDLDPQVSSTYVRRGQLYLDGGNLQEAVADLEKAKELDPNNKEAGQLLARAETDLAARSQSGAGQGTSPPAPAAAPAPTATAAAEPAPAPPPALATPPASAPPAKDAGKAAKPASSAAPRTDARPAAPSGAAPATQPAPKVNDLPEQPYRTTASVKYRSGPSNDAPQAGSLEPGTVVSVIGESHGWMKFRLQSGKEGFVYKKWLEPMPQ